MFTLKQATKDRGREDEGDGRASKGSGDGEIPLREQAITDEAASIKGEREHPADGRENIRTRHVQHEEIQRRDTGVQLCELHSQRLEVSKAQRSKLS